MKISILVFAICSFTMTSLFTSCNSSAQDLEEAEKDVVDANKDLDEANDAYLEDMENHKKITADKIATNQQSITDFNKRITAEKKEAKAEYEEKIAELEAKNSDMKKRMEGYQAEGKEGWERFKTEFNRDMDDLDQGLKGLTGTEEEINQ